MRPTVSRSCQAVPRSRNAEWSSSCVASRALTLPSRGRATSGFAGCRPPLMSNVRPHRSVVSNAPETHIRNGHPGPPVLRRSANQPSPATRLRFAVSPGCPSFGGQRTIGTSRTECIEPVRSNRHALFAVGRVRFPSQAHERRGHHHVHHGQQSKNQRNSSTRPCALLGPAEYRSAWAAGRARRKLSLAPRGVVPRCCRTNTVLLHNGSSGFSVGEC